MAPLSQPARLRPNSLMALRPWPGPLTLSLPSLPREAAAAAALLLCCSTLLFARLDLDDVSVLIGTPHVARVSHRDATGDGVMTSL